MSARRSALVGLVLGGLVAGAVSLVSVATAAESSDVPRPTREYWVYVCAESDDTVSVVRFGPRGASEARRIEVGSFPADIEGPHGINVSPDGRFWFVSISHGQPFGTIHKYSTGDDEWQGDATVGMFPATLAISPSTGLLYVANADFFGDHEPSTISVVETSTMTEVEQIPTGVMPHGARLSDDGRQLYTVSMMDDELVEIDALRFEVTRRVSLGSGHGEHGQHGSPEEARSADERFEPSWVTAPTPRGRLYVAGLSAARIAEVDLETFEVTRTFETAAGPYNVAATPDGRMLIVTYKKSDAVGFIDVATGEELARIPTTRRIPHGVAVSHDGRYSFVTIEGVGGEPGVLEIYDNEYLERVAAVEIGKQAGGLAVWKGPRG